MFLFARTKDSLKIAQPLRILEKTSLLCYRLDFNCSSCPPLDPNDAGGTCRDDIVNALRNAASCGGAMGCWFRSIFLYHRKFSVYKDNRGCLQDFEGKASASSTHFIHKHARPPMRTFAKGVVGTQSFILRSINPLASTQPCDSVCQPPAVNSWKVPFPKPAPAKPKAFVSTGKAPFRVLHFSDIHIDREYTVSLFLNATYKEDIHRKHCSPDRIQSVPSRFSVALSVVF